MSTPRRKSKPVHVGDVQIGGDAPVAVQSMCSTDTGDVRATVEQLHQLKDAGCEVVTLDALRAGQGVGTALLDAVKGVALAAGCHRLWLTTTNDNTAALRFYQRRGWNLVALHRDVMARWRQLKPGTLRCGDR